MIAFGWTVAIRKFNYLNSISREATRFSSNGRTWHQTLRRSITTTRRVSQHGRQRGQEDLAQLHRSPLYHLYHIGSEEISLRVGKGRDRSAGLSARSIQAIRASLESGLVRENQRMNKGLIFLTISIAGGPYVGLLGTSWA
jgi:biopolymer transport protein ExbB